MFAYVYFLNDKQFSKVPVGFIKKFDKETYLATNIYKVFWSRHIHSLQNEFDEKCLSLLSELRDPPPKHSWKVSQGEGFYFAHILRIEDSIDSLITSLKLKRPAIPVTQCEEEISTTEDEVATLHIEKQNKKQEDAEMKHKENAGKRKRAKDIFEEAKRSRKAMFSKLGTTSMVNYQKVFK
nr:uncharacterized protein LOC122269719 [Parasteatoda tepidariorum]